MGSSEYRLRQVLPPKAVFNPTIEEDARIAEVAPFSLRRLRKGVCPFLCLLKVCDFV